MEILAPVKNLQAAKVVVQSGCTEVYLGSPSFSARSNASNDLAEIGQIIRYCQQYDVKTFIAFNVVVFEDEINLFLSEVISVMNLGATGVIMQDIGLANYIKKHINNPSFEIHASTQMNVHNTLGAKVLQSLDICRLVVPREISFDNIRSIKDNTNIDIEAFIHGALCVSYSGQCYDSTLLDQKSANRGRCSQYCRMPQHILNTRTDTVTNARYPLNLKDMNNHSLIDEYLDAGVDSLKIEGRLKSIEYAAIATEAYANKKEINYDLKQAFNREFTTGLKKNNLASELVNLERPNNTGIHIGSVVSVSENDNNKLKFYKYKIEIQTNSKVNLGDSIRYLANEDMGQTVEQIEETDTGYIIYSKLKPRVLDLVYKTKDISIYKHYLNYENKFIRRQNINVTVMFKEDHCLVTGDVDLYIELDIQKATSAQVDNAFIKDILSKTNNTPYDIIANVNIRNGLYIKKSELKRIKNEIIESYSTPKFVTLDHPYIGYEHVKKEFIATENYFIQVNTKEQYDLAKASNLGQVMINSIQLAQTLDNIDFENDILVLPRIVYDDTAIIDDPIIAKFKNLCACELGSINKFKDTHNVMANYTFNITNQVGVDFFKASCNKVIASIELNYAKLKEIADQDVLVNIYGRVPVMLMDYCPINEQKENSCGSCRRCRKNDYVLEDEYNRRFPLIYEQNDQIAMYSEFPISLFSKRPEFVDANLSNFHIRFTNETDQEVQEVLRAVAKKGKIEFKTSMGSFYKEVL